MASIAVTTARLDRDIQGVLLPAAQILDYLVAVLEICQETGWTTNDFAAFCPPILDCLQRGGPDVAMLSSATRGLLAPIALLGNPNAADRGWRREHMGVEPTGDAEGRRPTVLKTAPTTGQDVLPGYRLLSG